MKNLSCNPRIVWVLLLTISLITQAQETASGTQVPETKLESFQKQVGIVYIKGYTTLGRVTFNGSVEVKCVEFAEAATAERQTGIVIEVTEGAYSGRSNSSFIDYDEVESLLSGIDYITNIRSDVTKLSEFEATYRTRGYLTITAFSSPGGKVEASVKCGSIGRADAYVSLQQLIQLRELIQKGKETLDSIK